MIFLKTLSFIGAALPLLAATACTAQQKPLEAPLKAEAAAQVPEYTSEHTPGHASEAVEHSQQGHHAKMHKPSHGYTKPGAAISYSHNLQTQLQAGETVTFQLALDESYSQGYMNVSLRSEGAFQHYVPAEQTRIDMSAGNSHVLDITLTPSANGRHHLYVEAITDTGMPRVFGLPVQVGPKIAMAPHAKMQATSTGENIIVMEAQEVIK